MAVLFLSSVFSLNIWGADWAKNFLEPRGLLKCPLARQMLDAMEGVDSLIKNTPETLKELGNAGVQVLEQTPVNPINTPTLELLCRRAYSRFRGYEHVFSEHDWKKPEKNPPANWESKMNFIWR